MVLYLPALQEMVDAMSSYKTTTTGQEYLHRIEAWDTRLLVRALALQRCVGATRGLRMNTSPVMGNGKEPLYTTPSTLVSECCVTTNIRSRACFPVRKCTLREAPRASPLYSDTANRKRCLAHASSNHFLGQAHLSPRSAESSTFTFVKGVYGSQCLVSG